MTELEILVDTFESAKRNLREFQDGYTYKLRISSYGNTYTSTHNNRYLALEEANSYYGDNGFCDIYTDNTELYRITLGGGSVFNLEGELQNCREVPFYDCGDYSDTEFYELDPYYYMSEIDVYMLERKDRIEEEIENAHKNLYFTRGLGMSIIDKDIWFESDELEAFRTIWLRRLNDK